MRKQIRILYPTLKPAINRCPGQFLRTKSSPRCAMPGFMVEILFAITNELGLDILPSTIDSEDVQDSKYMGVIVGNKSTNLLTYISEGRVDTIAIPFHSYGAIAFRKRFDLSVPIYNTTASFFYRKQLHRGNSWMEFFNVYSESVWTVLALLLLVVIIFLHVAKFLETQLSHNHKLSLKQWINQFCQISWFSFQFFIGHGSTYGKFKSKSVKFGLLILAFCHTIAVLGIYGSWILSLKLNPLVSSPIKDIDKLAKLIKNKEFHMVATPSKALDFGLLSMANLSILKTISDALEYNPIKLETNTSELFKHIGIKPSVIYTEADEQLYLDLQTHCGIEELSEHISNIPVVFVFRKGSPFFEPFNNVIRKRRYLFLKIINRYLGFDESEVNNKLCEENKELERLPYFGLTTMLVSVSILGSFVLIIENIVYCVTKRLKIDSSLTNNTSFKKESQGKVNVSCFGEGSERRLSF